MNRYVWRRLRISTAAVCAVAFAWLSLAIAADGVLARTNPELALRLWPFSGPARASLSSQLLADRPGSPDFRRIQALGAGALLREPLEATAAAALALANAMEGEQQRSTKLYRYAERLSRRNVETQLLLIEESVKENDIHGALVHYDRALRVSPQIRQLLLPILVQASDHELVANQLAAFLVVRPSWWQDFVDRLVGGEGSPRATAVIVDQMRLDPADGGERERLVLALRRLVEVGAYTQAWKIYRDARTPARADALLRNGSFEEEPLVPPFEWWFASDGDLSSAREAREGAQGQYALSLIRQSGRTGEVANQLLQLPPGNYRFTAKIGEISGGEADRPRIRLRCAGSNYLVTELIAPTAPEGGRSFAGEFTILSNCPVQWMSIAASSGVDRETSTPWIDALSIERR